MGVMLRTAVDQSFPAITVPSDGRDAMLRVSHSPAPVPEKERIATIDALRGVALLGILLANMQSFSMVFAAVFNPMAYGDLHGANYWVWLLRSVFTDERFMNVFSMLFGAGIVLMTSRIEAIKRPSAALHYRRMGWLMLFGLLHGYLLWYGDILFDYGLCGLIVYLFRKRQPRTLLVLGLCFIALPSVLFVIVGLQASHLSPAQVQALHEQWMPTPTTIANEVAAYRGSWGTQMHFRVPQVRQVEFNAALFRIFGLMLVGMALFRLGIFGAKASRAFYWSMVGIAVFLGIPLALYGIHRNLSESWHVSMLFFGWQYNYWASLLVSFGWIGLVMLASQTSLLVPAMQRLAAVGRMALTNYIMHSAICATIFYGYGFGLFGKVDRLSQLGFVLAIWAFQLLVSPIWLRHFQFGPLEWLWRSLTYLQWEPFRRGLPHAVPAAAAAGRSA